MMSNIIPYSHSYNIPDITEKLRSPHLSLKHTPHTGRT